MMHIYDLLHYAITALSGGFSERAADLAVTAIWQGALIACGLALCLRFTPRLSAAHRFTVWSAAFFTLVSLPVLALVADLSLNKVSVATFERAGSSAGPWLKFDARWSLAIAGLWVVVSLVRATDLAIHTWKLRKIWKEALPVEVDAKVRAALDGVNGRAKVCMTRELDRPCVIGFWSPRILIPDWLFARLTPGELEQIVMHEGEHLRRRDDWTNLLQKLCLVVLPLNPALVWIERRLCREREMACDEGVIRITRAPRAYAACLTSLAERGLERRAAALSLGAWQRRPELVHRVHSILRGRRGLSPAAARVLLGTVGCGLLVGAVELAQSPQLVAFVPEQNTKAVKTADVNPGLALSAGQREGAVSAMPVVFHPAAKRSAKQVETSAIEHRIPVMQSGPVEVKTAALDHAARATMLNAEMANAQPAPAPVQQWVVLTTWQVETATPNAGVKSDYDARANGGQKADAAVTTATDTATALPDAQQSSQPPNRITVTRLILRVFPATARINSADTGNNSATNRVTEQPGVAAVRGGWLVFQL